MTEIAQEAEAALRAWGGASSPPRLVTHRENAVFEVVLADGRHAALRLHRREYQSAGAIRSELRWTLALARAGLAVPEPIPAGSGDLVACLPTGRVASVVAWVEGRPLGAAYHPLVGSVAEQCAMFSAVGRMLAALHDATDAMVLPEGFTRPSWDEGGLLGPEPFWGRFWENPALTSAEAEVLQTARARALDKLADYRAAGADYGLIHADLMRENILVDGSQLRLIDFDDCGFGFRLYDLATLMLQNLAEPAYPNLLQAALDGYGAVRPLGAADIALLPMFVMLRCFASCGWAVPRMAQDDPKLRFYAERALQQARLFLDGA